MSNSIGRSDSIRSTACSMSTTENKNSLEEGFRNLRFVNEVVEGVVRDIMNDLDRAEMENGLEGGFLRCSHTTQSGCTIEINAMDLENLASPTTFDAKQKQILEDRMHRLAGSSLASLGDDTVESLFGSAISAAHGENELLAFHEVEDISFFTVLSQHDDAR